METYLHLTTVLTPGNPAVIALAKSILADAEIPYVVGGDEGLQHLYGFGRVEIQVWKEDADTARKLLSDL